MGSLTAERWKERQRQKEARILARGIEQGIEFVLERQATRRFNVVTGERLAAVGDAMIECGTGAELLAAAKRSVKFLIDIRTKPAAAHIGTSL